MQFLLDVRLSISTAVTALALSLVSAFPAGPALAAEESPLPIVYLTWQRDPTTTMTVQWISEGDGPCNERVAFRQGLTPWGSSGPATCTPLYGKPAHNVHHVELTGLQPAATYELRVGRYEGRWKFRTLSAEPDAAIRFVVGGDVNVEGPERLHAVQQAIAQRRPDFAVIGGDIAYANGLAMNVHKWLRFLSTWERSMVTPDGVSIPLVVAVGNHEVANGGYSESRADAPYFYSLFAYPAPTGYGVLDIGTRLSLFLLDSGHSNPIAGAQTDWLREQLTRRAAVTHKIPVYHRGAYPSVRLAQRSKSRRARVHWTPLFDEHGVRLAFEHHDHAYKRTLPIRNDRLDPMGVTYFGDGAWGGKHARTPAPIGRAGFFSNRRWYLAHTREASNYILVTLAGDTATVLAIDDRDDSVIEERQITVGTPQALEETYSRWWIFRIETWMIVGVFYLVYRRRTRSRPSPSA